MGEGQSETESLSGQEATRTAEVPITVRLILTAMVCGFIGMVAMLPVLVGVPFILDVFRTEPLLRFGSFVAFFDIEPTLELSIALFVVGGTIFLPIQFLVVGAYLPPESPRYARGITYGLIYWTAFLLVFWPGGSALAIGVFVIVSFLYHVFYGLTLGYLLDRWAEIPQHAV